MKLLDQINKIPAAVKLLFGAIVFGIVTYLVSENSFNFSDTTCHLILYATICFIFIAIMTFEIFSSFFDTKHLLYKAILIIGIPWFLSYITTAVLIQQRDFVFYQINFWVCLICWVLGYVLNLQRSYPSELKPDGTNTMLKAVNPLEDFILGLSAAWTISSVFITLGTTIFDYGKLPINNLQEIHSLLDLRINLAIIIGLLIAIKSIVFVLQNKKVDLVPLFRPREQVSQDYENANPFLQGFTTFLNIAINLIGSLGNIFYKVFATIVVYLFYIGGEIYNSISSLLKKSVNLLFYIFNLIGVITAFYLTNKTCEPLLHYLRENDWINSYSSLIWVAIFSFSLSVCMITINYFRTLSYDIGDNKIKSDIEEFNKSLSRAMQTLPYLIAVIWVTGLIIFFIAKIDFLQFTTFTTLGILSAILSSIVFVGFIIYLINNFRPVKQGTEENIVSLLSKRTTVVVLFSFLLVIIVIGVWYNFQSPNSFNNTQSIQNKKQKPQTLPVPPKFDTEKLKILLKDAIAFLKAEEYESVLASLNEASNLKNIPQGIKKSIEDVEPHVNIQEINFALSEIDKIIALIDKSNQ